MDDDERRRAGAGGVRRLDGAAVQLQRAPEETGRHADRDR